MKKIMLVLLSFLCLTGCSKEATDGDKKLNLENTRKDLLALEIEGEMPFSEEANINNLETMQNYGLDKNLLEEYLVYIPESIVKADMYLIVKVNDENKAVVEYQINDLFDNMNNAYKNYYPEEAKLLEDRLEKEVSGYLVYIISDDNEKVLETIKNNLE